MEREALALRNSKSVSVALSSSFEENKKKLPWPVSTGFISQPFGRQNHPLLKGRALMMVSHGPERNAEMARRLSPHARLVARHGCGELWLLE